MTFWSPFMVKQSGPVDISLLPNLIAYWSGNEATGDVLDLHVNALHLTVSAAGVGSNPGLVYPLARQYVHSPGAPFHYHARTADVALLDAGDNNFTIATWVYLDDKNYNLAFVSKRGGGSAEYLVWMLRSANRYIFEVRKSGVSTQVYANSFGSPPLSSWTLIIAWHDAGDDTLNLQINDGTVDSVSYASGVDATGCPFVMGSLSTADGSYIPNGRIGPTAFWKGVLTPSQRTRFYNGGAGVTYEFL